MLSAEGNENRQKTTTGLISNLARAAHFFVHFFAVVLHDYNVKLSEFSQLHVLWRKCRRCSCYLFFSLPLTFTLVAASIPHFLTAATKFSCCLSNNFSFLFSLSSSLSLLFLLSFAGLLPTFSFSLPSLYLYSKYVDLTINLSLILQTTRIQKQFPLSVFVFIIVVSASQDAGGYVISPQNKK